MATQAKLRCARCSMIVFDVFPQIMQDLMKDSNVPPASIYQKIVNNKAFMKKLNKEEVQIVQTLLSDGFTKLDVSLIYKIVKYFKIYIPPPSRKWGSNPQANEIEIGDDVERIRIARNELFHKPKGDISEEEMDNFYAIFTDVGSRMDKHLNKEGPNGYEQTIKNYRDLILDEETAEQLLQARQEIESLKETFTIEAGQKEVHIYFGKSIENIIEKIRQDTDSGKIPVKFIIHDVEHAAQKTKEINNLKEEFNAKSSDIVFIQAANECIVLYVEMKTEVLLDDVKLVRVMSRFLRHVLERAGVKAEESGELSVVVTSAEDDVQAYSDPPNPVVQSKPTNLWGGDNSLVLKLEVNNEVFRTPEKFQQSVGEFISNLIQKTNGRQLIAQKEVNVVIEPDESEVFMARDSNTPQKDLPSNESYLPKTSLDVKYSNLEYARSHSLPNMQDLSLDIDKEDKVQLLGAQCPLDSPKEEYLINIPPKFHHLKRRSEEEVARPWQHFFGFRRLLELKEKNAYDIVDTFSQRKTYLIDALNDKNMNQNKEILVMMLTCFARCCNCDSLHEKLSDVFEILQYSLFLKKSVVEFIDGILPVVEIHRRDYYQSFVRDLFEILVKLKSNKTLFRDCLLPIIEAIEKRKSMFSSDIFDADMETTYETLKMTVKDVTSPKTEYESPRNTGAKSTLSHSTKFLRVKSKSTEGKQSARSDRRRSVIPDSQRWKLHLGFSKLSQLHLASPEDIIIAFDNNKSSLKEALNDDNIINEKDMVSLILRCFGECAICESFYSLKVNIFEILRDSIFLKNHVISFVGSIAIGSTTQRIISEKQTLIDIFAVFDSFNSLVPQSVPFIHSILMKMDTAINAIRAEQSALIDEDMWHTYHTLMDRTKASSPKKSP